MNVERNIFEAIGGMTTVTSIVSRFYAGVAQDPILSAMYPADDMVGAEDRLRLFLAQRWGGPTTYSEQRGHPRLRLRHMPFEINLEARDHWLACFRTALDEAQLSPDLDAEMWGYVEEAANFLVNAA